MSMPKISVIMPTYNGGKYIRRAIDSVLGQSFKDFEIIVINDGSTDDTEQVLQEYIGRDSRVNYFDNKNNLGIQKTLNRGLKESKGKYIARIDDDDEWIDKEKLKRQIEFLENNPGYVLVGTGATVVDEKGLELFRYLLPESDYEIRKKILRRNCFVHSSVLFKRESVLEIGGYSENKEVKHIEDYDLWLKLGTVGKVANLPIYGIKFMITEGGISSNNKADQFKKNITLISKFKKHYPKYFYSIVFCYLRLFLYKVLFFLPSILVNKIIKTYKEC